MQSWNNWEKRSNCTIEASIKDLFSDLLHETKGLKYQITTKVLQKIRNNAEIGFAPVYFNSVTETEINYRFRLEILFKKFYTWLMLGLMKDLDG